MKLKAKINVYTAGMFIVLLILLNFVLFFSFRHMMFENEKERSYATAVKTVEGINQADVTPKIGDLLRAYLPVAGMFKVIDANGKSITTITDPDLNHLKDIQTTFFPNEKTEIIKFENIPYVFVSVPMITRDGEVANLQMVESIEGSLNVLGTLKIILVIITAFAIIPVFLSSQILSNIISNPILSMIRTMADIQRSGEHQQIPLQRQSKDELYQLGETFNSMIDQLKRNYETQEQFIANASHELKTPLTVIESYSYLLKRRGLSEPELFTESIDAIHSEAIRLRELTEQLLILTQKDAHWKMQMTAIPIAGLLHDIVRYFLSAFDCDIELLIRENITGFADKQKLKQLLYIFIENACKYGDGKVQIKAGKLDDQKGSIIISDNGIGIPAEDLPKVFERFYRVDQARSRKTGGIGLGLALAKEIATVMNVDIKMESEEGKGTTVKLIFSLADSN